MGDQACVHASDETSCLAHVGGCRGSQAHADGQAGEGATRRRRTRADVRPRGRVRKGARRLARTHRHEAVDERDRPVLHLRGGIALRMAKSRARPVSALTRARRGAAAQR